MAEKCNHPPWVKNGCFFCVEESLHQLAANTKVLADVGRQILAANNRRGGKGGMTVTNWRCFLCGAEGASSSTACPLICKICTDRITRAIAYTEKDNG